MPRFTPEYGDSALTLTLTPNGAGKHMNHRRLTQSGAVIGVTGVLGATLAWATLAWCAEPPAGAAPATAAPAVTATPEVTRDENRLTVAAARDHARMMHNIYAATLDVMHQHYFHKNRTMVPARAMEDVFEEMDVHSRIKARWISVNTRAMGVDHEPRSDFDRKAAAEIATGKAEYEVIEDNTYHRAGVIHLGSGCVSCHTGFFSEQAKTPRYAGLIISIPIKAK